MNAKAKAAQTSYVVLKKIRSTATGASASSAGPQGTVWEELPSVVEASSAAAAVRASVGEAEGVYVAVPARSWQPVTVKVERKTVVKLT